MKKIMSSTVPVLIFLLSSVSLAGSAGSNGENLPPVVDLLGMTPTTDYSCIAIWVPVPDGLAVSGIKWFNNDDQSVFPEVLLESGNSDYPVSLSDCQVVAQNVSGQAEQWSEVAFSAPVRCASDGLYVLFRFPAAEEYTAPGSGGGPAIGYSAGTGLTGWMSVDGQDWFSVNDGFGFAAVPVFQEAEEWMLQMNGAAPSENQISVYEQVVQTGLDVPHPNPFNPSTEIRFNLAGPAHVRLQVYDLQGRLVSDLINQAMVRGSHSVTWQGQGSGGRHIGSGLYFARLTTGGQSFVQKMVLLK